MKSLLAAFLIVASGALSAQTTVDSLLNDGIYRTYLLHVPPGFQPSENPALVLNFHGLTSTGAQQEFYSEMNAVADVERFVVAYPDGINNSWNLGLGQVDDYGFVSALIDDLIISHNVDPQRVYACGMSQGGMVSLLFACSMYDKVAAVASVAGGMTPGLAPVCQPTRPVPVMMINGTADAIVPYAGGLGNIDTDDAIDHWVGHNGCDLTPVTSPYPDLVLLDFCTAVREDHLNGTAGSEVALIRVVDGGHTWPGASLPIGVTNQDFEASQVIWDFFEQFVLSGNTGVQPDAAQQFSVGPNPCNGTLTINGGGSFTASLWDASGRQVAAGSGISGSTRIGTEALPAGPYVLRIDASDGVRSSLLVVQH